MVGYNITYHFFAKKKTKETWKATTGNTKNMAVICYMVLHWNCWQIYRRSLGY
jgi:hypothetical protein